MNADSVRAVGEETLVGISLGVGIEYLDPEYDLAIAYRPVKMGRMARYEPVAEGGLQRWSSSRQPFGEGIGNRAGCAANGLVAFREGKLLDFLGHP